MVFWKSPGWLKLLLVGIKSPAAILERKAVVVVVLISTHDEIRGASALILELNHCCDPWPALKVAPSVSVDFLAVEFGQFLARARIQTGNHTARDFVSIGVYL